MQKDTQTFIGHLEELRQRIIMCLIILSIGFIGFYFLVPFFLPYFIKPVGRLVFLSPAEAFVSRLMLALYGGIFLSAPFIIFQFWRFVSSGLYPGERNVFVFFLLSSTLLFFTGVFIGFFIVLPVGIKFLMSFGNESVVPMISVRKYISFAGGIVIVFGVVFQMPLIMLFLTRIGLVTPQYLSAKRKEAILGIFILAAFITPPDISTQLLLALPMWGIYEVSIVFSSIASRRRNK